MAHFNIFMTVLQLLLATSFRAYGDLLPEKGTTAFFIFGDSTVDSGNNNYINTVPDFQANFKPYGENAFCGVPTGRFSDGLLVVDYIAEYAKLPMIPPFMSKPSDFTMGVNFASGGGGVLPETNRGNQGIVIDLFTQLKDFEKVKSSLIEKLGEAKTNEIITKAVYYVSIGSNDYICLAFSNPKLLEILEGYVEMVIGNLTQAIQVLYEKGARKFGFITLAPLGCLPALRILNPDPDSKDGCFEAISGLALAHNNALKQVLKSLRCVLKGFKYSYFDFHNWIYSRMENPFDFGFKYGLMACCGSGPYRGLYTCGGTRASKEFELCKNANEHVFWDSFHLTQKVQEQFAQAVWNGTQPLVGPYNLEDLFYKKEKVPTGDVADVLRSKSPVNLS